jgi:photosystem II stability/assembly factor-like uncharacterized protein
LRIINAKTYLALKSNTNKNINTATCLSKDNRSFSVSSIVLVLVVLLFGLSSCDRKEEIELDWEERIVGQSTALNAVYFTNENNGHIVGGDNWAKGYYLYTADAGETWAMDSVSNKRLFALDFLPDGFGIAVGIDGYHYRKESVASDWTFSRLVYWDILRDVAYKNRTEGIAVGGIGYGNGVIIKLLNNAATSRDTFESEIDAICFSDENTVHAMGYGIVLRSTDSGETWTRLPVYGDFYRAIHFPSESIGYAVGSSGTIMKTTDAGSNWKKLRDGSKSRISNTPFRNLFFVDDERGFLVGENGTFWQTTDGGDNWQVVKGLPDNDFLGIHVVNGIAWLVSEEGRIFRVTVD